MKNPSATTTIIVTVVLLCALSMGGQQGTENGSVPKNNQPGFIPATQRIAYLPDGRIVAFPISMSEEEIDALAKRIAEGAVELPPGAKVIGWKPAACPDGAVQCWDEHGNPVRAGADRLPYYEQRVATIPTTKGKLDALANAAGILQAQIDSRDNLTNQRIDLALSRVAAVEKHNDDLTNVVNLNAAVAGNADSRLVTITNQLEDLKQKLDKFKEAACPVLRTANIGWRTRMELDSACGLR
jgi:hypothetical protein